AVHGKAGSGPPFLCLARTGRLRALRTGRTRGPCGGNQSVPKLRPPATGALAGAKGERRPAPRGRVKGSFHDLPAYRRRHACIDFVCHPELRERGDGAGAQPCLAALSLQSTRRNAMLPLISSMLLFSLALSISPGPV